MRPAKSWPAGGVRAVALTLTGALAAALLVFGCLYRWDNKYTAPGPQPIGGVLYVSEADLDAGVLYPVHEWEYYPGRLLGPEQVGQTPPSQYVFIGQHSGLDAGRKAGEAAGSASYRLNLLLPESRASYALQLPEIYCAYRLYVNGALLLEMGEPDPAFYRDALGETTISFEAAGRAEILLAVSSHGYLYNGYTHPIGFGRAANLAEGYAAGLVIRGMACVVALLLGVMFLFIRLAARYERGLLFSLLCLCTLGVAGAPLLRAFHPLPLQPLNAFYLLCYYAVFLFVWQLMLSLFGAGRPLRRWSALVGAAFCLVAVVISAVPLLATDGRQVFSFVSGLYKWAMVALMVLGALRATLAGREFSASLLFAAAFFAFALAADRLLPLFEPIFTGWFAELAALLMLLVLGAVLWRDMVAAMNRSRAYQEDVRQAQKRLEMQRQHYRMLDGQLEGFRAAQHDFRQQVLLMERYAEKRDYEALKHFIADYRQNVKLDERVAYTGNETVNVITRYYGALCAGEGIAFDAIYDLPATLPVTDMDLNVVLGNLLENAVEASRRLGAGECWVRVKGSMRRGALALSVENRYSGPLLAEGELFLSQKRGDGAPGQGLRSVQTTVRRLAGSCSFEGRDGVFRALLVLGPGGAASGGEQLPGAPNGP